MIEIRNTGDEPIYVRRANVDRVELAPGEAAEFERLTSLDALRVEYVHDALRPRPSRRRELARDG